MNKICTKCNKTKVVDDFAFRRTLKGERQPWCKECSKKYFGKYYKGNTQRYRARAAKVQQEAILFIRDSKDNQPCKVCNTRYPHYVLDYHHRDSTSKIDNIMSLASAGKQKVAEEMAKCDLICSNCHRFRTFKHLPTKWSALYH